MGTATAALDVQTGGGEVYATALAGSASVPPLVVAVEAWPPNRAIAARNLARFGGSVVAVAPDAGLPFAAGTFDLVSSRHPVRHDWAAIARVLAPHGTYLSQGVGTGSNRELYESGGPFVSYAYRYLIVATKPPTPVNGR